MDLARAHAQRLADAYKRDPSGVNECRLRDALVRLQLAKEGVT
ncbi:hypothetical protein [Microbacterium lacus]|nr:hypothetical protein [Microbacterium lacus]